MMKHYLFLLTSIVICCTVSGQQNDISLENYLRKDSVRLRLLLDKSTALLSLYPDSAKVYLTEAMTLSAALHDTLAGGRSKRALAAYYILKSDYDAALPFLLDAIPILEKYGNADEVQIAQGNLAIIYERKNDLSKSLEIRKKIVAPLKDQQPKPEYAGLYYNLAENYRQQGNVKDAEKYYLETLRLARLFKIDFGVINALTSLAVLYVDDDRKVKAEKYIDTTLAYAESASNPMLLALSQGTATGVYIALDQYEKAITIGKKALEYYERSGDKTRISSLYAMIANASRKLGDYKTADEYGVKHQALKDSLYNVERMKAMEELTVKYETEKIAQQKQLAEVKADRNRKFFIGTIAMGSLMLLSLGLYFLNFKNKKNTQIARQRLAQAEKELDLEKQYRSSELKALKAQMNPHFMFNAMNSIQSLILKGKRDEAYDYLTKFSTLIRENLNMSEKNFIYFDKELELIATYLQLEKLRFKTDFEYNISGASQIDDIKIPTMIIQPFVENAIKHGLLHKSGTKKLSVNFQQSEVLRCTVTDNGIGRGASGTINKKRKNKHESFSTVAIKKRFALLREYYKLDLGFTYIDLEDNNTPAGTQVIIKIPYLKDDE